MEILQFKTNITSPIGIQAIWDALKSLGINYFNIDFQGVDKILRVVSEGIISIESIVDSLTSLGYRCEKLSV
jgi:hypothetical protein